MKPKDLRTRMGVHQQLLYRALDTKGDSGERIFEKIRVQTRKGLEDRWALRGVSPSEDAVERLITFLSDKEEIDGDYAKIYVTPELNELLKKYIPRNRPIGDAFLGLQAAVDPESVKKMNPLEKVFYHLQQAEVSFSVLSMNLVEEHFLSKLSPGKRAAFAYYTANPDYHAFLQMRYEFIPKDEQISGTLSETLKSDTRLHWLYEETLKKEGATFEENLRNLFASIQKLPVDERRSLPTSLSGILYRTECVRVPLSEWELREYLRLEVGKKIATEILDKIEARMKEIKDEQGVLLTVATVPTEKFGLKKKVLDRVKELSTEDLNKLAGVFHGNRSQPSLNLALKPSDKEEAKEGERHPRVQSEIENPWYNGANLAAIDFLDLWPRHVPGTVDFERVCTGYIIEGITRRKEELYRGKRRLLDELNKRRPGHDSPPREGLSQRYKPGDESRRSPG